MDEYLTTWIKFHNKLMGMDEYRLTLDELVSLCRDFQADCFDGFVSNDRGYIEHWLDNHGIYEI